MAETLFDRIHKHDTHTPDVLSCLANLSNDEVFTPPEVVNQMLDMLPQELFESTETTFLDPACKTGVFLREIAKRLLNAQMPLYHERMELIDEKKALGIKLTLDDEEFMAELQVKIDHIFHKQLYGIAITELTSLLSRRSVYCSMYPNGKYSVSHFDNAEGNIRFRRIEHTWGVTTIDDKGKKHTKCIYCGASKEEWDRENTLETHAYEWIHIEKPEEILNMKFDVIISNPPYQLKVNETGKGLGAVPIYNKFVEQAQKLNPRYLLMIIPARWFSGGVGLDEFRKNMLTNEHVKNIVDYVDSNDVFPGVDVNGGICYFLIDNNYKGLCNFTSVSNGKSSNSMRKLDEFDILIRRDEGLSIIKKILKHSEKMLSTEGGISPQTPYGFLSTYQGRVDKKEDDCELLSSRGWSYVSKKDVTKSKETIPYYKPMISKLSCEHAGNPNREGQYRVLSRMEILLPNQICSQSYLTVCPSKDEEQAKNVFAYLQTKFVRFLILQTLVGMNLSISNFRFVPWQDFSKVWTDKDLYKKYDLSQKEIDYIENIIRPMDLTGGDD